MQYKDLADFLTDDQITKFNILEYPNGILNFEKRFDKILKNLPAVKEDLLRIAWKCMKKRADNLSTNLRLNEISILIFFQFY